MVRSRLSRSAQSVGAGGGIDRHQLAHGQHVLGQEVRPGVDARVERVAARPAGVLGQQAAQRACALPVLRRVVDRAPPPRVVAAEEPGPRRQHRVVDLGQLGQGGLGLGDPQPQAASGAAEAAAPRLGQRALAALQREAEVPAGAAVAVPAVDHRLGRPQDRQRLAAVAHVGQLAAHQAAQHAAPPVRGQHRHEGHPGGRQHLLPRHAQLEAVAHGDADRGRCRRRPRGCGRTRTGRGSPAGRSRTAASRGRHARRRSGSRRTRPPRWAGSDTGCWQTGS